MLAHHTRPAKLHVYSNSHAVHCDFQKAAMLLEVSVHLSFEPTETAKSLAADLEGKLHVDAGYCKVGVVGYVNVMYTSKCINVCICT